MQRTYQLSEMAPTRADDTIAQLLAATGQRLHFTPGAMIQQQGDSGDGFWLIESGSVTICRFGREGELTVYAVLGAGVLFGELAYFAQVPRQVDAVAEGEATLVRINAAQIDHLLDSRPDFARWLLRSLAGQLRSALNRIEGDRNLSAEERLARVLAGMAANQGGEIATTQQHLADLIGVSRITAGQVLAKLQADGLITRRYRRIAVLDHAALTQRGAAAPGASSSA